MKRAPKAATRRATATLFSVAESATGAGSAGVGELVVGATVGVATGVGAGVGVGACGVGGGGHCTVFSHTSVTHTSASQPKRIRDLPKNKISSGVPETALRHCSLHTGVYRPLSAQARKWRLHASSIREVLQAP